MTRMYGLDTKIMGGSLAPSSYTSIKKNSRSRKRAGGKEEGRRVRE